MVRAKSLAHRPHHPAGAQDHAPAAAAQHCFHRFLAGGLGAAVSAQGIAGLLGPVGAALLAVEHKIRAHLQQAAPRLQQRLRKGPRRTSVHRQSQVGLAFGFVHSRVGAAIEHPVGPVLKHRRPTGRGIGEIQGHQTSGGITAAAGGDQLHPRWHLLAQGLAQLAGSAGE
jgi:hypothetical protein